MWAWWLALHGLLAAATLLVGVTWPLKVAALLAIGVHGALRCPPRSPELVLVAADGACTVPGWHAGPVAVGVRTVVCPLWVSLDGGKGRQRPDLLLIADQLEPVEWARLRALLDRARCE